MKSCRRLLIQLKGPGRKRKNNELHRPAEPQTSVHLSQAGFHEYDRDLHVKHK